MRTQRRTSAISRPILVLLAMLVVAGASSCVDRAQAERETDIILAEAAKQGGGMDAIRAMQGWCRIHGLDHRAALAAALAGDEDAFHRVLAAPLLDTHGERIDRALTAVTVAVIRHVGDRRFAEAVADVRAPVAYTVMAQLVGALVDGDSDAAYDRQFKQVYPRTEKALLKALRNGELWPR